MSAEPVIVSHNDPYPPLHPDEHGRLLVQHVKIRDMGVISADGLVLMRVREDPDAGQYCVDERAGLYLCGPGATAVHPTYCINAVP